MKKINKFIIILILILCSCHKQDQNLDNQNIDFPISVNDVSQKTNLWDFSEIKIYFRHSRRIPYNSIAMEINRDRIFVKVAAMEGEIGFDYSNFENEIKITQEYYETVFQKIISINYNEIIDKSKDIIGMDGSRINITIGSFQNNMEISLWSINYDSYKRKTNELIDILNELFSLFDLEGYIF
jgi:hypothetical protein